MLVPPPAFFYGKVNIMKVIMFYRPNSEHERLVLDYLRDFKMQTGHDISTMDVDTSEGMELCKLYGIMQYPALVATDNDGKLQNVWTGETLPLINEVSYYTSQ
jgi:hypothetical protein